MTLPLYAASDRFPAAFQGRQTMTTVFPTLVCKTHLVKQADQGVESTMDPAGFRRGKHAIVCIEKGILMPPLLSTIAPLLRVCNDSHHPVAHHCIQQHIKCGGGERIYLRHLTSSLEYCPIIPPPLLPPL